MYHWVSIDQTGPNRGYLLGDLCRSCLLSIRYTFSRRKLLKTVLQNTPVYVQNGFKTTSTVCNSINKRRNFMTLWKVTSHFCCKIQWLWSTQMKCMYNAIFYLEDQKTSSNGANWVQITTECRPPASHRMISNESYWLLFPWFRTVAHLAPGIPGDTPSLPLVFTQITGPLSLLQVYGSVREGRAVRGSWLTLS